LHADCVIQSVIRERDRERERERKKKWKRKRKRKKQRNRKRKIKRKKLQRKKCVYKRFFFLLSAPGSPLEKSTAIIINYEP